MHRTLSALIGLAILLQPMAAHAVSYTELYLQRLLSTTENRSTARTARQRAIQRRAMLFQLHRAPTEQRLEILRELRTRQRRRNPQRVIRREEPIRIPRESFHASAPEPEEPAQPQRIIIRPSEAHSFRRSQKIRQRRLGRRTTGNAITASVTHASAPTLSKSKSGLAQSVLEIVNDERSKEGLEPLGYNQQLEQSALAHANDMSNRDYFSHASPEGEEAEQRIRKTGYLNIDFDTCNCTKWSFNVGENIAKGQETPKAVMEDWMHSPGHRANILSKEYTEIGIAKIGKYWVQNFGSVKLE